MTITTSAMVSIRVNCTSCTELRIDCDRSTSTSIETEGGSCARKFGSSAFTASVTATVFASGCRCTASTIERRPFSQLAIFSFSTQSSTLAMSASRTGRAVAPGHDQRLVELGARQRAGGVENEGLVRALERAERAVGVGGGERRANIVHGDALVASASGSKRTRTAYFCAP